jgi:hypothetical protein
MKLPDASYAAMHRFTEESARRGFVTACPFLFSPDYCNPKSATLLKIDGQKAKSGPITGSGSSSQLRELQLALKATTELAIQPAVLHGPCGFEAQLESQQMTNPKGEYQISIAGFPL